MSADKLKLPVRVDGTRIVDADGAVVTYRSTPPDVAARANQAAADVINEALAPAWTWEPDGRRRNLLFRGERHDTIYATDEMAQLACDAWNAAGVTP